MAPSSNPFDFSLQHASRPSDIRKRNAFMISRWRAYLRNSHSFILSFLYISFFHFFHSLMAPDFAFFLFSVFFLWMLSPCIHEIGKPERRHSVAEHHFFFFFLLLFFFLIQRTWDFEFILSANAHPPERKTTTPTSPSGPPPLWPYSGGVKIGSFVLPLVSFFNLCIFALIRKLWGENPKKASGWGK